jgi:hypothetical protein
MSLGYGNHFRINTLPSQPGSQTVVFDKIKPVLYVEEKHPFNPGLLLEYIGPTHLPPGCLVYVSVTTPDGSDLPSAPNCKTCSGSEYCITLNSANYTSRSTACYVFEGPAIAIQPSIHCTCKKHGVNNFFFIVKVTTSNNETLWSWKYTLIVQSGRSIRSKKKENSTMFDASDSPPIEDEFQEPIDTTAVAISNNGVFQVITQQQRACEFIISLKDPANYEELLRQIYHQNAAMMDFLQHTNNMIAQVLNNFDPNMSQNPKITGRGISTLCDTSEKPASTQEREESFRKVWVLMKHNLNGNTITDLNSVEFHVGDVVKVTFTTQLESGVYLSLFLLPANNSILTPEESETLEQKKEDDELDLFRTIEEKHIFTEESGRHVVLCTHVRYCGEHLISHKILKLK